MSGLRFRVGEMAELVVIRGPGSARFIGEVVPVVRIASGTDLRDSEGGAYDYDIVALHGAGVAVLDWQLRKIDPPTEPANLTRNEECEVTA